MTLNFLFDYSKPDLCYPQKKRQGNRAFSFEQERKKSNYKNFLMDTQYKRRKL